MSPTEAIVRFVVGGTCVCGFAFLADILKPKSFAGLFGAAPSIALATLLLTVGKQGPDYVATEERSMIGGSIAFLVYAWFVGILTMHFEVSAKLAAPLSLALWLVIALGIGVTWLK